MTLATCAGLYVCLLAGGADSGGLPKHPLAASSLVDIEGKRHVLASARASVLVFTSVDCPISNRYAPKIGRLISTYSRRKVAFFRVYVDRAPASKVRAHGKEYRLVCPAILDSRQSLAAAVGATVTPEVAILDASRKVVYRGGIDGEYLEHNRLSKTPVRQDVKAALDEVLAGKQVSRPITPAVGCNIPKRSKE